MKLQTKRLILRQVNSRDIQDLIQNLNNIKVSKWLLVVPYPYTLKDAKWWVTGRCQASTFNMCIARRVSKTV